jgi:hypothetical protein
VNDTRDVKVRFQLTEAEIVEGLWLACWGQWWFRVAAVGGPVLLAVGIPMSFLGDSSFWWPLAALGLFWSAFAFYAAVVQPRLQYRRNPRVRGEQVYVFSEAGINLQLIDAESTVQWSYFEQVDETRKLYAFRYRRRCVNPIPKRAFTNQADETAFRELVARKTKARFR